MTDEYLTSFVKRLPAMDDESLLRTMVGFDAAPQEYRPEAIAAAREEMERRRLTAADLSNAITQTTQEALDSVFDDAVSLAEDGRTVADIEAHLRKLGVDEIGAAEMAKRAWDMPADQRRRAGRRNVILGLALAFGGLLVTAVTYSVAATSVGGGQYVIAWGMTLGGVLQFLRGLRHLTR
jgi:L-lactate utilization protein LutC